MHQKQDSQEPPQPSSSGAGDQKSDSKKDDPRVNPGPMATIQDDDERLLAQIGYKQVCPQPVCVFYRLGKHYTVV